MAIDQIDGGAAAPGEEQELSLRESLEQQFAQANQAQDDAAAAAGADDGAAADGQAPGGRQRDGNGRFVAKADSGEQEGAQGAPAAVAATDPAVVDPAAQAAAAPAQTDIPAPISWNAEAKAKWAEVPPDVRKYIAEREENVHRQFTRHDEERNFGRAMSQTLQPYAQTLQEIGVPPDRAVAGLLNVDNVLRKGTPEQKLEMVHEIMRSYQIPAEAVFNHQPLPQDPRLNALQQQLQAVQQQLQQGQHQQQSAAEEEAARLELATFKANAPHLEAVREEMASLLTNGMAVSLSDAYEKAVLLNPETRKLVLAQQNAAAQQTRRVNNARQAGSSIAGAPGGVVPTPATTKRSLRDELRANFGDASSRI
jgi:hypothetical protein